MAIKLDAQEATLRLFSGVQEDSFEDKSRTIEDLTRCVSGGYILNSSVTANEALFDAIERILVVNGEQLNSTFHKSWDKVENAPIEQLVLEQVLHYFTTYGFKSLGIYDENYVFIPSEYLDVPDLEDDFKMLLIKAYSAQEIEAMLHDLGSSDIALSDSVLEDIMTLVEYNDYSSDFISGITNRELYSRLCDLFNFVPTEPVDYLRYLIFKLTGESLVINNRYMITRIKESDGEILDGILGYAPENLGSIFLRFKNLFLAMKSISNNKAFFNRLSKSAKFQHVPMGKDVLNSVTSDIKRGRYNVAELIDALQKANVWRKIRLAETLNYRITYGSKGMYKVRNGRAWIDLSHKEDNIGKVRDMQSALNVTLAEIFKDMQPNVSGIKFYIPDTINYALPSSQKSFVGNLPANTYVTTGREPILLGVHWYDTDRTVDLDISLLSVDGKIGWDRNYRTGDGLFSGDLVQAPNDGATELFYLKEGFSDQLVMANYFNMPSGSFEPVSAHLVVATATNRRSKFMVDPNSVILPPQSVEVKDRMSSLGLITNVDGENRVYLNKFAVGNSSSSGRGHNFEIENATRNIMFNTAMSSFRLSDFIGMSGGLVVHEIPEDGEYVDLSPESLDVSTILGLFA